MAIGRPCGSLATLGAKSVRRLRGGGHGGGRAGGSWRFDWAREGTGGSRVSSLDVEVVAAKKELKECPAGGSFTSGNCFFFLAGWWWWVVVVVVRVLVAVVALGLGEIKWGKQEKDGRRSFPCPYAGTGQELVSYLPDGWMGWMDGWRTALLGQAARVETGRLFPSWT